MTLIDGNSSRELRERCMQQRFVPIAREILRRCPEMHSVGYLVGQYWCDEAEDAVHEAIVPFAERDPVWPPAEDEFDAEERAFELLDQHFGDTPGAFFDFTSEFPMLDSNTSAITAFASHCREGCDQEMSTAESHDLYAVARRAADGDDVVLTIVGNVLRPEWEDRFDVGFEIGEEEMARREQELDRLTRHVHRLADHARPRRGGLFGFLRRLFGGS